MTSTITWKEVVNGGHQIIKLDDRTESMPKEGEERELNGRRYKVVGLGNAEVLLEAVELPPADPANPAVGKDGKPIESKPVLETQAAARRTNDGDDSGVSAKLHERTAAPAAKSAPASKLADHKPAPHHVPQRRHSDPLARTKVATHKKK